MGSPAAASAMPMASNKETPQCRMLFVLTMEVLNTLYADDLVVFLAPLPQDASLIRAILQVFANASGLKTNVDKCQFTPIRCNEDRIQQFLHLFPTQLVHFPCKYLGISLSIYQLRHSDL